MGKFKLKPPFPGKGKFKPHAYDPYGDGNDFEIIRKNLEPGVAGEANNDNTIYVDVNIPEDSIQEKEVVAHEGQHMKDMKDGILGYGDDWIKWRGKKYKRENGMIFYNGKWLEEGYKDFPWEKRAYKAGDNAKQEN